MSHDSQEILRRNHHEYDRPSEAQDPKEKNV